jgi:thioredoxin:protein disulfide reductase
VLLKVYDSSDLFKEYRNDPRFPELKVGLPFFLITDTQGNLLYKTNDYLKTEEMQLFLEG